jgi:EEF1A lysine methyltransferase 4
LNLGEKCALVIDNSTADAVACGGEAALLAMEEGVERRLSEHGLWISLSYSAFRFEAPTLPLEVTVFRKVLTPK